VQRDRVADQAVRQAAPVDALVMPPHDVESGSRVLEQRLQNPGPDHRVLLHMAVLLRRQRARAVEDRVVHPDLADVVQLGAELDQLHQLRVEAQLPGRRRGVLRDPSGVALGVGVLGLERVDDGLDTLEEQLLDPGRLLLHQLGEVRLVAAVLQDQAALVERVADAAVELGDLERLHHVVVRARLEAFHRRVHVGDAGEHHHRQVGMLRAQRREQLDAVELRHPDVRDHDVDVRIAPQRLERLTARARAPARAAEQREPPHGGPTQGLVVFDHQTAHR
jgi:hypothetical protein